jgi:hypothetical protein
MKYLGHLKTSNGLVAIMLPTLSVAKKVIFTYNVLLNKPFQ